MNKWLLAFKLTWSVVVFSATVYGFLWLFQTVVVPSADAGLGVAALLFLGAFVGAIVWG